MTFECSVGRLYWGAVRDLIKAAQFRGDIVSHWESRGIIERKFIIKGDDNVLRPIIAEMMRWSRI
jgi:hypothetical protein